MLGEFVFEQIIDPEVIDDQRYRITFYGVSYVFSGKVGVYGTLRVHPDSIRRHMDSYADEAWDPVQFLLDSYEALKLHAGTVGNFVRELTATVAADARLISNPASDCAMLASLSYAQLEGYQTGHPWMIPNKGRMGFSAADVARYAPESRQPLRISWIAVHKSIAEYRSVEVLTSEALLELELELDTRQQFTAVLANRGLTPAEYQWLPVHPWQWDEMIVPLFAADLAAGRIITLGEGPDRFLPQQSIRTLSNIDAQHRHHIKLPLSIFNTSVWRGLPSERTLAAPALTEWILRAQEEDHYLRDESRVLLLGEVASVTVRHEAFESIRGVQYQYRELLGAIWRQSIHSKLEGEERARTLASLLYTDQDGRAFIAELVARSGLTATSWLQALFGAILPPLLHFLYKYGIGFNPHGENVIVVFDSEDRPTRLAIKDFVDDLYVYSGVLPELRDLPAIASGVVLRKPPEMMSQMILSSLFVGHFRYLSALCAEHLDVSERDFWRMIREEILGYQNRFPELADRYELFDLLGPDQMRLCLNRKRLYAEGYSDLARRPEAVPYGRVPNPLYSPSV